MRDLIYISGGITKNPHYKWDFSRGERKVTSMGFFPINPAKLIATVPMETHSDYMDISIAWLEKAKAIYMLRGWSTSEGATKERMHAKLHGIPVFYEDGAEREGGEI